MQKRLDAEESWTAEERQALDERVDRAREEVAARKVYGPDEARRKLDTMRAVTLQA